MVLILFIFKSLCDVDYMDDNDLDTHELLEIYKLNRIRKLNRRHGEKYIKFRDKVKLTHIEKYIFFYMGHKQIKI